MRTRAQAAIDAQADALDAFAIDGIRHNIPFLAALMAHPRWRAGKLSTGFIAEEFPDGFQNPAPQGESARMLAAVAVAIDHLLGQPQAADLRPAHRARGDARDQPPGLARRDGIRGRRDRRGRSARRALVPGDGEAAITVRYAAVRTLIALKSAWKPGEPVWSGSVDGEPVAVQVRPIPNGYLLCHGAARMRAAQVYTEREADSRG